MFVFGSGSDVLEYSHARMAKGSAPLVSSPIADVIGLLSSWYKILNILALRVALRRTAGSVLE